MASSLNLKLPDVKTELMLKRFLSILIHLLRVSPERTRDIDDEMFKHLDGAEFTAILPERPSPVGAE